MTASKTIEKWCSISTTGDVQDLMTAGFAVCVEASQMRNGLIAVAEWSRIQRLQSGWSGLDRLDELLRSFGVGDER